MRADEEIKNRKSRMTAKTAARRTTTNDANMDEVPRTRVANNQVVPNVLTPDFTSSVLARFKNLNISSKPTVDYENTNPRPEESYDVETNVVTSYNQEETDMANVLFKIALEGHDIGFLLGRIQRYNDDFQPGTYSIVANKPNGGRYAYDELVTGPVTDVNCHGSLVFMMLSTVLNIERWYSDMISFWTIDRKMNDELVETSIGTSLVDRVARLATFMIKKSADPAYKHLGQLIGYYIRFVNTVRLRVACVKWIDDFIRRRMLADTIVYKRMEETGEQNEKSIPLAGLSYKDAEESVYQFVITGKDEVTLHYIFERVTMWFMKHILYMYNVRVTTMWLPSGPITGFTSTSVTTESAILKSSSTHPQYRIVAFGAMLQYSFRTEYVVQLMNIVLENNWMLIQPLIVHLFNGTNSWYARYLADAVEEDMLVVQTLDEDEDNEGALQVASKKQDDYVKMTTSFEARGSTIMNTGYFGGRDDAPEPDVSWFTFGLTSLMGDMTLRNEDGRAIPMKTEDVVNELMTASSEDAFRYYFDVLAHPYERMMWDSDSSSSIPSDQKNNVYAMYATSSRKAMWKECIGYLQKINSTNVVATGAAFAIPNYMHKRVIAFCNFIKNSDANVRASNQRLAVV